MKIWDFGGGLRWGEGKKGPIINDFCMERAPESNVL